MTMWAIQQFTVATTVWGVAVARVKAPPPPPGWSVTPRALPRDAASVNVTITGTPTDGEGFYDPGPGFACRLNAAVDGGIQVNAVTYHSPTSITLNVSTVGASGVNHAVTVTNPDGQSVTIPSALLLQSSPADFDGDARSDIAVYRPSNGTWYILRSSTAFVGGAGYGWGAAGDTPISGDYDGDGRADIAVYRPASAHWFILRSSTNFTTPVTYQWGSTGDQPVPSDYDGDGRTDIAIYRPSSGTWYILKSSTNFTGGAGYAWGAGADEPVPGDYDGDGRTDIAVYRPASAHWFILKSSSGYTVNSTYQWGSTGDIPIPIRP